MGGVLYAACCACVTCVTRDETNCTLHFAHSFLPSPLSLLDWSEGSKDGFPGNIGTVIRQDDNGYVKCIFDGESSEVPSLRMGVSEGVSSGRCTVYSPNTQCLLRVREVGWYHPLPAEAMGMSLCGVSIAGRLRLCCAAR